LPRTRARPDSRSQDPQPEADRKLVERIRSGSELDFNRLYERYFQRIYSFAYTRLRNHADTEEVVQETFTAVFRSIEAFRGQSTLLSWIYGIAKNTVNNHLRRSRNQELRHERAAHQVTDSGSFAHGTPEEHLNLRRTVDEINDRLRSVARWQTEVFLLRHVEDLPIQEIAERTERSNDAVRSSLYRVKRLLLEASETESAQSRT